jgi:hypothetical protein
MRWGGSKLFSGEGMMGSLSSVRGLPQKLSCRDLETRKSCIIEDVWHFIGFPKTVFEGQVRDVSTSPLTNT